MKFKLNRLPIYGLSIKSGKIHKFTKQEDAIQFLEGASEPVDAVAIRRKTKNQTSLIEGFIADKNTDNKTIMATLSNP